MAPILILHDGADTPNISLARERRHDVTGSHPLHQEQLATHPSPQLETSDTPSVLPSDIVK